MFKTRTLPLIGVLQIHCLQYLHWCRTSLSCLLSSPRTIFAPPRDIAAHIIFMQKFAKVHVRLLLSVQQAAGGVTMGAGLRSLVTSGDTSDWGDIT